MISQDVIMMLAAQSYTEETLDEKTVEKIMSKLSRKELKQYISALKKIEKERTVIVALPMKEEKISEIAFQGLFPNKKIVYNKDESLISGVRIIDNCTIYEFSIKNILASIYSHVTI